MNAVAPSIAARGQVEQARAVLNILEDYAEEKVRLGETHSAVLNILEDAHMERQLLQDGQRAVLNILDDLAIEKSRLEDTQAEIMRSEQALRQALKEREVLLQEVHHRVKNNLQVISSLINMQVRVLEDGASREALAQCQMRVEAIALIHEKLYQSKDFARVPFSEYAKSLAHNVFLAIGASAATVALEFSTQDVALPVDKAIPCGLILNELITNSLKHAFRDGRSGTIRVSLARVEDRVELGVSDNGVGLPPGVDLQTSGSLGLQLIRMLSKQVGADLCVDGAHGMSVRLMIPMEA
jgi:two-component sensor histidine kinase